jgi:hypothetical protein
MIVLRSIHKEETVRRVVVLVLASAVAFVLALGAGFFDSKVGIAKAKKCPPGSTPEKTTAHGNDVISVCTITQVGTPGNDVLYASKDPRIVNKIYGYGGNDRLYGYGSKDGLVGGDGQDTLYGGRGGDGLFGGPGRDKMYAGPGDDEVQDHGGRRDLIWLGPGGDYANAADRKRDKIGCGAGKDSVEGDGLNGGQDGAGARGPVIDSVQDDCEPTVDASPDRLWWETLMGPG